MKKNIKLAGFFAASALTLAFSGCSNDSQEQNALFRYNELNAKASLLIDNRYSGIMQDFGTNTYYPVDFIFSPESLIQMDNKVYSKDIAEHQKNKSELEALKIKIDSSELSQFANLSIKESAETPGSFELSGFFCPQFYFNAVCSMITNPGNISILKGITSEKYLSSAEKLITAVVTDGIVKSHCTASYYLLADNLSL